MMIKLKPLLCALLVFCLVGIVGYYIFWFKIAGEMSKQIDLAWNGMIESGTSISGEKPKVTGFPGRPTFAFSGYIHESNDVNWTIRDARFTGFPVPGFTVELNMPQGLGIAGPMYQRPIELDQFFLAVKIPLNLPTRIDEAEVRSWQQAGGSIPVEKLEFRAKQLHVNGQGTVGLDGQLQISGQIMTRVVGMDALLADLTEQGVMKGQSAIMAQSFLQMINQRDLLTGETYFETPVRIQNLGVFLGPLRVATVPELNWSGGATEPFATPAMQRRQPPGPEQLSPTP